jgi:hypothetical protein
MRRLIILLIVQLSIFAQVKLRAIDQDCDGMSDVWQQKYSVPSADANKDYNGTGMTNIQKSLLGLDPRAPNLLFQVKQILDTAHNELRLRFNTAIGKSYQVESSTDLANWSSVGPVVPGNGSQVDVVTTMPLFTPVFFRARFAGDVDADSDGLTAWEENELGTNDNSSDTDGDRILDVNEFENHTDPLDYYNGGIPFPLYRVHTRAAAKEKLGFTTFHGTTPRHFFLRQVDTSSIEGGNPEGPVGGVITTTVDDLDTGHTTLEYTGTPFDFTYAPWGVTESYENNYATWTRVEHTEDTSDNAGGGAYYDPPNLVIDLAATLIERVDRVDEYTTDMLISRTVAALPPLPPIEAPYDYILDDQTFATVEVLRPDETRVYATHSEYRFEWPMSPNLPVFKQITWIETFAPRSGTAISTVLHWEGTANYTYTRYCEPSVESKYYVVPFEAQMIVDGNRDGEMSFNDPSIYWPDQTSQDRPYRFWLNDDDDTELSDGSPTEAEQVPPLQYDYLQHRIVSKRNLEDFARLRINVGVFVENALASGQVKIALKWKTVDSGTPAINIYPSADGDGSDSYLKSDDAAAAQIDGVFNDAVRNTNDTQTVDTSGMFIFKTEYWNGLNANSGKKCFLFEAASEGKGELEVILLDSSGSRIGEGGSVWLDLVNVKEMYERAKATPESIPNPHQSATTPEPPTIGHVLDPNGYQWSYPAVSWVPTNEYVVCVHGWNVTYDEARTYFAETTFKRLWQRGYKGRLAALYWPTLVGNFTFNESEYRAWFYGEALKQYVNSLPSNYSKELVAHSLGNAVAGSAVRKGMNVDNYAMVDAAVPASCYDDNPALEQGYGNSPDDDTDPLTLNFAYKNKLIPTSANLINFYLGSDDALKLWRDNNSLFKPQVFYEAADGDHAYKYYPGNPSGEKLFLTFVLSPTRILQRMEESLAYAAKSSTNAVGADGNTGGSVPVSVNLASFGYEHEHSAFWSFSLQKMATAYDSLMDNLQVEHNP